MCEPDRIEPSPHAVAEVVNQPLVRIPLDGHLLERGIGMGERHESRRLPGQGGTIREEPHDFLPHQDVVELPTVIVAL